MVKKILLIAIVSTLMLTLLTSSADPVEASPDVRLVDLEGPINPITATYLLGEIERAEADGIAALIIRMDTPGGLDISMRKIVKKIISSKVPVIAYTAPTGARAASAGVFISLSAHISAMAPGTTIGAAHPVNLGGEDVGEEMNKKIENDAAAYIRAIAKQRGHNENWAEDAVRKSVSATADEAKELNVIDFIAGSLDEVLKKADGMSVEVGKKSIKLDLKGAKIVERPMSFRQRALHALTDPNIVFILLTLGIYGIIYEFANPGFGFAGIGGAILIILALYGIQALPINLAGLALIILAVALFIAEAFTPTFGVLAAGGLISFALGSLIFIDAPRDQLAVSGFVIIPAALLTLAFIFTVVRSAWKVHRRPAVSGKTGMIGLKGRAQSRIDPLGQVLVHGEVWTAETVDTPIKEGQMVAVVGIEGLKLKVKRIETEDQ